MRILHIDNGYAVSKVHSNLVRNQDIDGISQTVYCPVRTKEEVGVNQFESVRVTFVYSYCIKSWYKFAYQYKVYKLFKDMTTHIDVSSFDICHASTLFSDGALALNIYRKYGTPYVVAVRATDIFDFIGRKLVHTWQLGREILLNARKIYFISASGMRIFEQTAFAKPILDKIKNRFELRPNGIEDFWLEHIDTSQRTGRKICYIGTFLKRKNIVRLAAAIEQIRKERDFADVSLCIIGGGNDEDGTIGRLIENKPEYIEYLGSITDRNKLIEQMRKCAMFAMPSFSETFGLVYVEALTQNLPIIYSKNDGIDGLFDATAGIAVNPKSIDEITAAIKRILTSPCNYGNMNVNFSMFNWKTTANKYIHDYIDIIMDSNNII